MEASFVDLRKKSSEIIRALSRKERVTVLYRGKPAAIMEPIDSRGTGETLKASRHKAFGMWANRNESSSVEDQVKNLRRRRFDDL
jgi:antitoxin (DNA-binding transcriptional repressor) of toxin-antitoxin stability system